jgi:hypothetical protein
MSDSIRLDVIERVMSEYAETIGRAVEEQTQLVTEGSVALSDRK